MTTATQIEIYNSALFAADGANSVKIGKTIYSIEDIEQANETSSSVITIKKGNTVKQLMPNTGGGWTLWSGRCGLPKLVEPEFI